MAVDVALLALVVAIGIVGALSILADCVEIGLAGAGLVLVYFGVVTQQTLLLQSTWVVIVGGAIVFAFRVVGGVT